MAETQQTLFEKCCACLDDGGVKYSVDRIEDSDIINFTASGDDLQMNCTIRFIGGVVSLYSLIPARFSGEKLVEGIMAVNEINRKLVFGSLDFDSKEGIVIYRVTNCFNDCAVETGGIFMELIRILLRSVDDYNDKLFMLSKGMLNFSEFMEEINK